MALEVKKRKRSAPSDKAKRPEKRLRPTEQLNGTKRRQAQAVRLDELIWRNVAIPEQMEDYEGLYGLEEVDDVEVIKGDDGRISFKAVAQTVSEQTTGQEADNAAAEGSETADGKQARAAEIVIEEQEWSGFGDDVPVQSSQPSKKAANKALKKEAKDLKKASKRNLKDKSEDEVLDDDQDDSSEDIDKEASQELSQTSFAGLLEEDLARDEGADISAWQSLRLSPDTLAALSRLGFAKPTLIQQKAIPQILMGHDVIGKAATGSGKTLAFGIPILEYFLDTVLPARKKKQIKTQSPIALILAPTRELAHQISKHMVALCAGQIFEAPRIATITGGLSVQKQKRQLQTADVVIGTPGRLWEVIESSTDLTNALKKIRFLVIDEADRLLSQGHFKELEEILNALDRVIEQEDSETEEQKQAASSSADRQTLIFSATFHKGLQQKLAGKSRSTSDLMSTQESMEYLLKKVNFREEEPKYIDVNPVKQMASGLKEGLVECGGTEKDLYLYSLLLLHPRARTLVFTNSISAVRRITPFLQTLNQPAQALHSSMPQKARLRAVERFTASKSPILIATDVAARGLDIPGVQLVIHYHVPRAADMYIHRSGRTARAETTGRSILISAPEEVQGVKRLIAKVHAQSDAPGRAIKTVDIDRRIVARLKPRATLAKKIADVTIAKEKGHASDKMFAQAAEDLGIDYDSEEFEGAGGGGRQGRGNQRKKKARDDRTVTKHEMGAWKAELRSLLAERVNTGVSARYIAGSGTVDMDALLRGEHGDFLGEVGMLDL